VEKQRRNARPEGHTMWNDTELQHDVENEVGWELSGGLTQISVTVKSGAVELGGHVDSFWEKCAAERAVWRVAHVNHVTNGIRVVVPFNKQRDDDEIALAAMTILEWNCLVPDTVEVQVAEACVTLSGSVERHCQKEEAARALCALNGITGIHNDIVLKPSVILGDIKANIEASLRRNALVDSSHIKAQVAHGVVSLRGAARSRAEYDEAMRAAWAAPGVAKIEDHITIGFGRSE
jgi:osmotically-inducible protein OsmY